MLGVMEEMWRFRRKTSERLVLMERGENALPWGRIEGLLVATALFIPLKACRCDSCDASKTT